MSGGRVLEVAWIVAWGAFIAWARPWPSNVLEIAAGLALWLTLAWWRRRRAR